MAPRRHGISFICLISASFILAACASDSGTCALDSAVDVRCQSNSGLIQSKVLATESTSVKVSELALTLEEEKPKEASQATSAKTIIVKCQFSLIEQDDNEETGEALTYGMCVDDNDVVYYMTDDSQTEDLDSGSIVSVEMEEIKAPKFPGADQGPWKAEGKPLYRVVEDGLSLLSSAQVVAAKNRLQYGVKQEAVKEIGFLMVLLNYTDRDLVYSGSKASLTEKIVWSGMYSKPEDWDTDPVLIKLKNRNRGSFGDVLEKASGGKLRVPASKGRVVTVQMGKAWSKESCSFTEIGRSGLRKAKEQFPGLDPNAYDFREIFMPYQRKPECKGLITGWNFIHSGVAKMGCGHPDNLPNPGACTAWYSCGDTFVRSHELGHNLGLNHDWWLNLDGTKKYLDPESWLGASSRLVDPTAPARFQLGFLKDKEGEVLHWREQNVAPVSISSISRPVEESGAGFMAVRWPCPICKGSVIKDGVPGAGFLWLQFRGNSGYSAHNLKEKYQNKVYVHFQPGYKRKVLGKGTELLTTYGLDMKSPAYSPKGSPYSVHVCAIGEDFAKVSLAATPSEAKERCSQDIVNVLHPPPTTTTTTRPPPPTLPPSTFTKHSGKTCGWRAGCRGDNHRLNIGKTGQRWDGPVAEGYEQFVCGTQCLKSSSCGGFVYDRKSQKCHYRKIATCGVKVSRSRDCYERLVSTSSQTIPPPEAFAIHESKTCGRAPGKKSRCPRRNRDVKIGAKNRNWDYGQTNWNDTVSTSCGQKCLAFSNCGGFIYNKRMRRCYYLKNAQCGRHRANNIRLNCWVKSN